MFFKVNFHPMDPSTLASGSQDGIMKFFDLRSFDMVAQFLSNTGSVRDLQFNPHAFHQVICTYLSLSLELDGIFRKA
jgi:WD40 repeat protein